VAKLRATDVQMLVKELRGDLEFITMRALEKDRARLPRTLEKLSLAS
jgi:hypothetical protein